MDKTKPGWKRMRFKKNKVWLALDQSGNPLVKNNKVLIKYQLDQEHEYWVNPEGVNPLSLQADPQNDTHQSKSTGPAPRPVLKGDVLAQSYQEAIGGNAICIFADGASSGNPGPSGVGVVLRFGTHEKEISRPIGMATNNIAELEAIKTGLLEIKKTSLPVRIFTDSNYAHGVLTLGWKAKKNQRLIESIKELMTLFNDLKLIKVKGHSGIAENERADRLATLACRDSDDKNV